MDEEQKYLEERHNKGVIINDDDQDWGGCPSTYEEDQKKEEFTPLFLIVILPIHYIHCNFETKSHFMCYRFSPFHVVSPYCVAGILI